MLTAVERVLILKGADLLSDVGPRHLLGLANVAREIEIVKGDTIYKEDDPADALYMVVEGHVRLSTGDRTMSEVGPGEAFGTWSLVDDSARGHRAECTGDGLTLALHRDEFYDLAAGDLTLLQEVVRALAKRLRALVAERPEEARVESEGVKKSETQPAADTAATSPDAGSPSPGAALSAAAVGRPLPGEPATPSEPAAPPAESAQPEPFVPIEKPKSE
jgi:CRP/FNR family cyclic AMP-dependent transcriptional regulator